MKPAAADRVVPRVVPILSFDPGAIADGAIARVGVDLQMLIATRLLITGDSRSGKSRMARQLLEQTYGHVPHLVIDPEGDYASLRERFDYLLVGRGGELAADVVTAAQLARSLFQLRANAIMDLSDLKPMVQREYVAAFVGELTEIHQSEGHPTLVVVDEAQFLAPEGGKAESHDALWNLSKRGGKRGLCLVAIPQRLAELSKEVAGGLQNRLVFTTTLDNDLERATKMLGFRTRDQREQLERLPRGECFAYGPAIGEHRVVRARGVPETLTTHPDVTKGARPSPPPPRESLNALVEQLREFAAKDKAERKTAEDLQARIRELERALEEVKEANIPLEEIENAVANALHDERQRQDRYRSVLRHAVRATIEGLRHAIGQLESVDATVGDGWMTAPASDVTPSALPVAAPPPDPDPNPVGQARPPRKRTEMPHVQQRIIDAIAFLQERGPSPTIAQVAILSGLTPNISTWRIHLGALRKVCVEDVHSDRVRLSEAGLAAADASRAPQSREQLHNLWRITLKDAAQRRLLNTLIAAYPGALSRAELGDRASVKHNVSTMRIHVGRLRKFNLIESAEGDSLRASRLLFPVELR